ncbi:MULTISPECIES: VOC family protein [Glutamicibacter]|uniref:VOC family protein n=1 Tax=Glutamicibacter halophytocola TaxID=1933880 RepID=A0A5B8I3D8_9MICC|nr:MULTISPECIES: VOC family protein [Glutamicibacter]MBF6670522.1 VOC family protein [Glutamicibacter sp. FBE19]QDY66566.1 VOC family protein [Glutamicibacter halophytocola]UUX58681.1 VOC family protein [Glutamicibacter halophytocola]
MRFRHLTIDCVEPYALAVYWSQLTGWPISEVDVPGDSEVLIEAPAPLPGLLFIRVPEAKSVKNRVHIDWQPTGRSRDDEVERAVSLGASIHEDHRSADGRGWVTLHDPEGNEFCIERSETELAR